MLCLNAEVASGTAPDLRSGSLVDREFESLPRRLYKSLYRFNPECVPTQLEQTTVICNFIHEPHKSWMTKKNKNE